MITEYRRREKIVGFFTLVILVLLFTTIVVIGRGKDWFRDTVTYIAVFDETYNLKESAAVRYHNADIGKVKDISLAGDKVKVTLKIFAEFSNRIREDSVASIQSPTLIGSEFVAIRPGDSKAPVLPEGAQLKTVQRKSVSDILEEFQVEKTAKMVVAAVQGISETAQELRNPDGPLMQSLDNIHKTTIHIEQLTASMAAGKGTVGSILKTRELIDAVLRQVGHVEEILGNVAAAAGKTPETIDLVNENLETFKNVGDRAGEGVATVNRALDKVESHLNQIKTILTNIEKGSYDIPPILRNTREGIRDIRSGVENIDQVVESVKQNPLIRSNLPAAPPAENTDAGLRQ